MAQHTDFAFKFRGRSKLAMGFVVDVALDQAENFMNIINMGFLSNFIQMLKVGPCQSCQTCNITVHTRTRERQNKFTVFSLKAYSPVSKMHQTFYYKTYQKLKGIK